MTYKLVGIHIYMVMDAVGIISLWSVGTVGWYVIGWEGVLGRRVGILLGCFLGGIMLLVLE